MPFFFSLLEKNYSGLYAQDPFVVVLDAGHGGHDPGNLGNGYLEKNIALNIVLHAGKILEKDPSVKVIYTRKDDTFVDLYVRGEVANKANADLFVSVHCDSHSSDAHGAGTFVLGLHANEQNFEIAKKENSVIYLEDNYATRYADYDINSPESVIGLTIMQEEFLDQSISLAKGIQDNFSNKLKRKDRKVKQAGFIVLHQTFMPSVLVETGFLTNDKEGAYLNSSKGQYEMGTAIADAILGYKSNALANFGQRSVSSMPSAPDPDNPAIEMVDSDNVEETVANSSNVSDQMADEVSENMKDSGEIANEAPQTANGDVAAMIEEAEKKALESIAKNDQNEAVEVGDVDSTDQQAEQVAEVVVTEVNEAGKPKIVKEEIKMVEPAVVEKSETMADTPNEMADKETVTVSKNEEEVAEVEPPKANIEFRVQLMASGKDLSPNDAVFKGLGEITKEPYKGLYRYMHGSADNLIKANLLKKVADAKGFTTSFLVAYKDGVRIDVKEARKYVSE